MADIEKEYRKALSDFEKLPKATKDLIRADMKTAFQNRVKIFKRIMKVA